MLRSRGFTLVELLVTLVVLAILTTIAIPAFKSWVMTSRTLTVTEELNTAIQLARSEALKRRKNVVICRANAALTDCENGVDWSNGWLIRQVSGNTIRVWNAPTGSTVSGPAAGITFGSNGLGNGAGNFEIKNGGCADSKKRTIAVSTTGNTTASQGECTPS